MTPLAQTLVIECGAWLVGMPITSVIRLVSPEDAPLIDESPSHPPGPTMRDVGNETYVVWDLAALLRQPPQDVRSLVLIAGLGIPLALSAGRCRQVGIIPNFQPIYQSTLRVPWSLGCFIITPADPAFAPFGLQVDPRELLTAPQLSASRQALDRAHAATKVGR